MKKEFVPLTEVKLLKELGFDEPCLAKYQKLSESANYQFQLLQKERKCNRLDTAISAPLYQQSFRWLREVHNIDIVISPYGQIVYRCNLYKNKVFIKAFGLNDNYEELLELALKESLKLILEIK